MIRFLKLCYPCAMRLDLFYKYRLQRPGEPLEHLKERLTIAEQGIPNCHRQEERQCWSRFLVQLADLWEDHVEKLRNESDSPR